MLNLVTDTHIHLKRVADKRHTWILTQPHRFKFYYQGDLRYEITVPSGFDFDFASVPLLFQGLFPKVGTKTDVAALLHDWLYATQIYDRRLADRLFYYAMLNIGVPKFKAWSMYQAVRLGGGIPWNRMAVSDVNKYRELGGYDLV